MTAPVFVTRPGAFDGVQVGAVWTLTGTEARHAATVQRLREGERIDVVDGAGTRLTGQVVTAAADAVQVSVTELHSETAPVPRLVLVQGLAKGGRDEMAIEAATEIGADAVQPWQSERSVVHWRGEKVAKGLHRWEALTLAATKVARRARLPEVRPFLLRSAIVEQVRADVAAGAVVLVLHEEATAPLAEAPITDAETIVVIVGPEGGITAEEVQALTDAGAHAVLMGPNVLRSSTAGPAALAVLSHRTGRWA